MKPFYYFLSLIFLLNCSSVKTLDSWTDSKYLSYQPKKILIIGVTNNLMARKLFEEKLASELNQRNKNAIESYNVFETTFTSEMQTEATIQNEIERLKDNGFDAVLISAVKGVTEKTVYSADLYRKDYYWRRHFGSYYYVYQSVYFDPGYYEKYNIYTVESTLYDLKGDKDKSLVWVASYHIIDPKTIGKSVNDYVKAIVASLEKETIISPIH